MHITSTPYASGIASNILADRLRTLVEEGLLTRDDVKPGQRATYSLTEPAIRLVPVMAHLAAWGLRHRPPPGNYAYERLAAAYEAAIAEASAASAASAGG
ncbi:winged helix-turn-helix transcriptional regulator [Streptomyces sp. NPDC002851]